MFNPLNHQSFVFSFYVNEGFHYCISEIISSCAISPLIVDDQGYIMFQYMKSPQMLNPLAFHIVP
jgi:hypothetical protein